MATGVRRGVLGSVLSMDMLSGVISDGFIYGFDVRDLQTTTNRPSVGGVVRGGPLSPPLKITQI
jgi:hypothetical protein